MKKLDRLSHIKFLPFIYQLTSLLLKISILCTFPVFDFHTGLATVSFQEILS